jgi:hypothetical protein
LRNSLVSSCFRKINISLTFFLLLLLLQPFLCSSSALSFPENDDDGRELL